MGWFLEGSYRYPLWAAVHGLNNSRCSVRPSALVTTPFQCGSRLQLRDSACLMVWAATVFSGEETLALSQIRHLGHVFPFPDWAGKRIDKALWTFFWSGKRDLVARTPVNLPKVQDGFGVVNFRLKAEAFALQWLKRFFLSSVGRWRKHYFVIDLLTVLALRLMNSLVAKCT